MNPDYVLKFKPNLHNALWGCESWEISAHPAGPGVVANGPLAGKSLAEVCPGFSLLVKVIDAKTRLSVQVHPNERTAPLTGGEPKTEMWCMLGDGAIYAGLKPGVGAKDIAAAVADGRFEELLARHEAKRGDVFFIPGGLVHAIGDGVRLYEVQQSSNTTYRLYDWNRVGADGRPRELHVEKSLVSIDYSLPPPAAAKGVECPFFSFRQIELAGTAEIAEDDAYTALFVAEGAATANGEPLECGESALVPPGVAVMLESKSARIFATRQTVNGRGK